MANVQIEHGFTRIADSLYEALIRAKLPGRPKDVAHAIIRLTYGYGKREDAIAVSQLAKLTGLTSRDVRRALDDLESLRIIRRGPSRPGRARIIAIVKDYEKWGCGERGSGASASGADATPGAGTTGSSDTTSRAGATPTSRAGATLHRQIDNLPKTEEVPPPAGLQPQAAELPLGLPPPEPRKGISTAQAIANRLGADRGPAEERLAFCEQHVDRWEAAGRAEDKDGDALFWFMVERAFAFWEYRHNGPGAEDDYMERGRRWAQS